MKPAIYMVVSAMKHAVYMVVSSMKPAAEMSPNVLVLKCTRTHDYF